MAFFQTRQLPSNLVKTLDGNTFRWFSGTDYLGLAHDPDFKTYLAEGINQYGTHFGSSRNNSLQLAIYEQAEQVFANWQHAKSALLVSSGMLAGQIVSKEIASIATQISGNRKLKFHYAPGVHPALWGEQYIQNQLEWQQWAEQTISDINQDSSGNFHIICTDAIGSPLVKHFDLPVFDKLQNTNDFILIIDQSHSLGVVGKAGIGATHQLSQATKSRTVFISSLNKALGIPAGVIWGEEKLITLISQSPLFAGASPPAPAYIFAFEKLISTGLYNGAHLRLKENIAYFNQYAADLLHGFESVSDYPVYCSKNSALFDFLLENGIMASRFSYPRASDPPVTRIVISAAHQKEDLDLLAEVCQKFRF